MNATDTSGFQKLIQMLPRELSVLDVGAGGLEGENTSEFLLERFKDYTGICIKPDRVELYNAQRKERGKEEANIIVGDFYTHDFGRVFDVVVLDLNIERNLSDWESRFDIAKRYVKHGGCIITYFMMDDTYTDVESVHEQIRKVWISLCGANDMNIQSLANGVRAIPGFELITIESETRRPEVAWVLLRYE